MVPKEPVHDVTDPLDALDGGKGSTNDDEVPNFFEATAFH